MDLIVRGEALRMIAEEIAKSQYGIAEALQIAFNIVKELPAVDCKQQLNAAYGIMVTDSEPEHVRIKPKGPQSPDLKRMLCIHGYVCNTPCTPECEDYEI